MTEDPKKLRKKILMLCTGGTIGMLPKDENDPESPLSPASWEKIKGHIKALDELDFDVQVFEFEPLIDSSDMHPKWWIKIAQKIRDEYDSYDGFVILHGTDTMAYTASALSFLLEHLGKPVIVTGSQLPLARARTDAAQNLVTSLMIAAATDKIPMVPEVAILFDKVLLRGNRARKVSSSGLAGFETPNIAPLAEIGEHIVVNEKLIRKIPEEGFYINETMEESVVVLDIFPGISPAILNSVFSVEKLKGVILRTYGTGNAPTDEDFLSEIDTAINKRGLTVVNITQCNQGRIEMGLYDASSALLRLGVISGVDMTPEAALVKLMFLIGMGYNKEDIKEQMQRSICGEQSFNVFNLLFDNGKTEGLIAKLSPKKLPAGYDKKKTIETATLRFDGLKVAEKEEEKDIAFSVFMNYPSADIETRTDIPQCLGIVSLKYEGSSTEFTLRCTERVKQVISDPGRPVQVTVVSRKGEIKWTSVILSIYTDTESV